MTLIIDKADALAMAWSLRYGDVIEKHAALLLLAVADLETGMGEYRGIPGLQLLPGPSHNWGQIQRRALTADEKASLARGIVPPPRNDGEFLSGDTSPDTGAYHVWLCRFPNDIAGADKMLSVIVDGEKLRDKIATMTPTDLAQSMYDARYYEGSHSRTEEGGPAKNVAAYASSIASHFVKLQSALVPWTPGAPSEPATPDPSPPAPVDPSTTPAADGPSSPASSPAPSVVGAMLLLVAAVASAVYFATRGAP